MTAKQLIESGLKSDGYSYASDFIWDAISQYGEEETLQACLEIDSDLEECYEEVVARRERSKQRASEKEAKEAKWKQEWENSVHKYFMEGYYPVYEYTTTVVVGRSRNPERNYSSMHPTGVQGSPRETVKEETYVVAEVDGDYIETSEFLTLEAFIKAKGYGHSTRPSVYTSNPKRGSLKQIS
jgi:hypothetical protein